MSSWWAGAPVALVLALACGATAPGSARGADQDVVARGAYLAAIMDCGGCHTPGAMTGAPDASRQLAGGTMGFRVGDLGVFYPPNLTSSRTTGLGNWTAADIEAALRQGLRPDGRELSPAMPWRSYAALEPADMAALVAFLQSLPAVEHQVPEPLGLGAPAPLPYLDAVLPQ